MGKTSLRRLRSISTIGLRLREHWAKDRQRSLPHHNGRVMVRKGEVSICWYGSLLLRSQQEKSALSLVVGNKRLVTVSHIIRSLGSSVTWVDPRDGQGRAHSFLSCTICWLMLPLTLLFFFIYRYNLQWDTKEESCIFTANFKKGMHLFYM